MPFILLAKLLQLVAAWYAATLPSGTYIATMLDGIAFVDERVGGVVASMRIYCNDLQPLKALLPMLVSVSGRVISAREEQPLKAPLPMLVSVSGRAISAREVQF